MSSLLCSSSRWLGRACARPGGGPCRRPRPLAQASALRGYSSSGDRADPPASSASSVPPRTALGRLLFERNLSVPSLGGSLWAETPFHVKVTPQGTTEYPNLERAFIKVLHHAPHDHDDDLLSVGAVDVDVKKEGHKLTVVAERGQDPLPEDGPAWEHVRELVQIPCMHNLNVTASGRASIEAEDFMESDYCLLKTKHGDITVDKIKTGKLSMHSDSGDVICEGHIQAKVNIDTHSGNVIVDKRITGPSLVVDTDSGDIRMAACYSETSKLTTNTGSMHLRNIHNDCYIAIYNQGDLKATSIDGSCSIYVKKGDVDAHFSRVHVESRIHVEQGNVTVRLSDKDPLKISIDGADVIPDVRFSKKGKVETKPDGMKHYSCSISPEKFSPSIHVVAENGTVILESQDWAASLSLKMPLPKYGENDHPFEKTPSSS